MRARATGSTESRRIPGHIFTSNSRSHERLCQIEGRAMGVGDDLASAMRYFSASTYRRVYVGSRGIGNILTERHYSTIRFHSSHKLVRGLERINVAFRCWDTCLLENTPHLIGSK